MNIINKENSSNTCFAALKLIEQLYKDGYIEKHVYQNILNDYADVVDLSAFVVYEKIKEENIA